jgi:hypothetical protein
MAASEGLDKGVAMRLVLAVAAIVAFASPACAGKRQDRLDTKLAAVMMCFGDEAERVAAWSEPSATLADVVLGRCSATMYTYESEIRSQMPGSWSARVDQHFEAARDDWKRKIIDRIVTIRNEPR